MHYFDSNLVLKKTKTAGYNIAYFIIYAYFVSATTKRSSTSAELEIVHPLKMWIAVMLHRYIYWYISCVFSQYYSRGLGVVFLDLAMGAGIVPKQALR